MAASSRKKAKKDETSTVEEETPSRTTSGSKRTGSKIPASKKSAKKASAKKAPSTPKTRRKSISPVARHTRSAVKKKQTKDQEEDEVVEPVEPANDAADAGEKIAATARTVADMEVDRSPSPKRKGKIKESGSALKGSDNKKKIKVKKQKSPKKKQKAERSGASPIKKLKAPAPTAAKPAPSMDVSVHRVRHLNYRPNPILFLATTPFDPKAADYVALSRENGTVELKSPDEKWRSVATVAGMSSRTVDVIAWTCGTCSAEAQGDTNSAASFSSTFHQTHTQTHSRRTVSGRHETEPSL